MTIPRIAPSTAKLFATKRGRRQIIVSETKPDEVAKTVQRDKIEVVDPAPGPVETPVPSQAEVSPTFNARRRG